jgi:hypothetical protein
VVLTSLVPIALGRALAIGVVAFTVAALGTIVDQRAIRVLSGVGAGGSAGVLGRGRESKRLCCLATTDEDRGRRQEPVRADANERDPSCRLASQDQLGLSPVGRLANLVAQDDC